MLTKLTTPRKRRHGVQIVRLPGREGYYLRWYEKRSNIVLLSCVATTPHNLRLKPMATGGLVLIEDPPEKSPYNGLQAGDIVLAIAGQHLHDERTFTRILDAFDGKLVRLKVNKGGRRGTTQRLVKAGDNLAQARAAMARWQELREAKAARRIVSAQFNELVDAFLKWAHTPALSGYSPKWLAQFSYTKKNGQPGGMVERLRARFGAIRADAIDRRAIEEYIREREAAGLKPGTLRHEVCLLRRIFAHGIENHLCSANPARDINIRQRTATLPKFLTENEINVLLDIAREVDARRLNPQPSSKGGHQVTCTNEPIADMRKRYNKDGTFDAARIMFLLLTGLRKTQFIDLRWSWYNAKDGTITLQHTAEHREKSGRAHVLPLPAEARAIIDGQPRCSDYIFPNLLGGHDVEIAKRMNRFIFSEFERRTGRHLHIHMLRHTALTHLLKHTGNLAIVSRFATHSSAVVTEVYAKVLQDSMARAVEGFSYKTKEVKCGLMQKCFSNTP